MPSSNRALIAIAARCSLVVMASTFLLAGCNDDSNDANGKVDGIYEGAVKGKVSGTVAIQSFYTLISGDRAISFSPGGLDTENTSETGADIAVALQPVRNVAGAVTGYDGTASGTGFGNGIKDASLNVVSMIISSVSSYAHLPPPSLGQPNAADVHPDGFVADYVRTDGAGGNEYRYSANFLSGIYNQPSDLGLLANTLSESTGAGSVCGGNGTPQSHYLDGAGNQYLVCPDGSFSSEPSSTCRVTGKFSLIDQNHNLYKVSARITQGCADADSTAKLIPGTYTGLAYADVTPTDGDGDGVANSLDKCPETPKGVAVDGNGCPLDSDGDGVPDYLDKCPGTPPGVKVGPDGCPIAESESAALQKKSRVVVAKAKAAVTPQVQGITLAMTTGAGSGKNQQVIRLWRDDVFNYPYETVYGDVCRNLEPTPGCTFSRQTGQRITVSDDPDYDQYGFGSDDLWFVKFDGSGNADVYNDLGVYQYTARVSDFAGYIGGTTIGVGTSGYYWENVSNQTYWFGDNGVLYSANTSNANYGQAIN